MQCAPSVQNWCEEMLCFVSFNTSAGLFKFLLKLLHWWELGILWGKSCKNLQVPIAQTDWKSFGSEPSHRNYTKAQEHLDAQCPKLNSKAPKSRRNRGIPSEDASRRTGASWLPHLFHRAFQGHSWRQQGRASQVTLYPASAGGCSHSDRYSEEKQPSQNQAAELRQTGLALPIFH